jgi:hypothetical protein
MDKQSIEGPLPAVPAVKKHWRRISKLLDDPRLYKKNA